MSSPRPAFLFTDLRGFSQLVETLGGPAAATVLFRFRDVVRSAVADYPGADIRTEGETSYIVFPLADAALRCGLAIAGAASTSGMADSGLSVAVGIDSGVSETPDGYLGASMVCGIARPGEVVVTERVRAQTGTLPIKFERAKRPSPGTDVSAALYVATPKAAVPKAGVRNWRPVAVGRWIALAGIVALIAAGGAWSRFRPGAAVLPPGPWTIGVQVPLADEVFAAGQGNGVLLAVNEANAAGGIGGAFLEIDVRDEGDSYEAPDEAAARALDFVSNGRVIAIVGPTWSNNALSTIPITNRAGLLNCSPANSRPSLTKPRFGALDLRSDYPDRIAYVRVSPSDDIQGPAAASYAYHDLGALSALVIDDTSDGGRVVADSFENVFQSMPGAAVIRRALNPGTTDFSGVLGPLTTDGQIGSVYFGGYPFDDSGEPSGVALKNAMLAMGFVDTPFQSWDGFFDGSGSDPGSFIQSVGAAGANTHVTRASTGPVSADFVARYRAAFGSDPDEYTAAAYACTQVILESLRSVAQFGVTADGLREAVRAYAVDPTHRYQTVLGTVGFDGNGDSIQQFVTFYKIDLGANGNKGDWIVVKQQDFGPAP